MTNRRLEREQGRREATEDMSEDLSEGEKGDSVGEMVQYETPKKKYDRQISNLEVWSEDKKEKKLYVVLLRYTFHTQYHFALALITNYPHKFLNFNQCVKE